MSQIFTISPLLMPHVSLKNLKALPQEPGVYYAIKGAKILYIGKARNLRQRWCATGQREHHQLYQLKAIGGVRLHYRVRRSDTAAKRREAHDIKRFKPPMNDRIEKPPFSPIDWLLEMLSDLTVAILLGAVLYTLFTGIAIGFKHGFSHSSIAHQYIQQR